MFNIENCFDKKTNKPIKDNINLDDEFDEFINKLDVKKTTKKVNARSYYLLKCKLKSVLEKEYEKCIMSYIEIIEEGLVPEATIEQVKDRALFFLKTKYKALRKYDSKYKKLDQIEEKYKIKVIDEFNIIVI